jgi:hypothetical protein
MDGVRGISSIDASFPADFATAKITAVATRSRVFDREFAFWKRTFA